MAENLFKRVRFLDRDGKAMLTEVERLHSILLDTSDVGLGRPIREWESE